jgi:hypothetical protein
MPIAVIAGADVTRRSGAVHAASTAGAPNVM